MVLCPIDFIKKLIPLFLKGIFLLLRVPLKGSAEGFRPLTPRLDTDKVGIDFIKSSFTKLISFFIKGI